MTLPLRLALILTILLLGGCESARELPLLDQVHLRGNLLIMTRNSPTTYYEGVEGPAGFEYDLVSRFAESLDVEVEFIVPNSFETILPTISAGEADFAAAGLTITEARKKRVRFTTSYQQITQQLLYFKGIPHPKTLADLEGYTLEVVAGSSHVENLQRKKRGLPSLGWTENSDHGIEDLIFLLKERLIDYTVADSNEVALHRNYYPELRVAFDLTDPEPLGWAFRKGKDTSLYDAAQTFLKDIQDSGELAHLIERHYGHAEQFNYVDRRAFRRDMFSRLIPYQPEFVKAAKTNELDWRLLAAIGYQESHWNPKAVSPTGVRGIMMLTQATAKQMGVKKRTDPIQSIHGGARYFARVKNKIPQRIQEPDRTWMALAAYNIGFGHLEDARRLTQAGGNNPDLWVDVKKSLPLLNQKKWYKKTRYGYARGRESVRYVDNIRSYHDILTWTVQQYAEPEEGSEFSYPALSPAL
ncbi:MAG TPA: membrane-bound lytic murein transglycosylase MltF [Chromatiales bacterium]|nr:membrane-bound lytic murein transglycosylase MltF [Chromatiales bacterium]